MLKQQAAEGNQMAKQLLPHEQATKSQQQPATSKAGSFPKFGVINIIAG
jgi:hypothetical protein